jgi:phospholipid/cholesterol/gamma-HCH transport system ATP-binding protein
MLPARPAGRVIERRETPETIVKVRGLTVGFGDKLVIQGLDLDVYRGEVLGCVGGSGTGKSVLLRTILGLVPKRSGLIEIFDRDVDSLSSSEFGALERRMGVMFQLGALFSGLTVKQNVEVPMREHLRLSPRLAGELAMLKIELAGLDPDAAGKYPSELSGGMTKRAALARALALDP